MLNPGLLEIRLLLCPCRGMPENPQQLHLDQQIHLEPILLPVPLALIPVVKKKDD